MQSVTYKHTTNFFNLNIPIKFIPTNSYILRSRSDFVHGK